MVLSNAEEAGSYSTLHWGVFITSELNPGCCFGGWTVTSLPLLSSFFFLQSGKRWSFLSLQEKMLDTIHKKIWPIFTYILVKYTKYIRKKSVVIYVIPQLNTRWPCCPSFPTNLSRITLYGKPLLYIIKTYPKNFLLEKINHLWNSH